MEEWQQRALDSVYLIVWLDGIVFKVRHNNKIINKSIYIVAGLNTRGHKEVIGLWINEQESASFWSKALTDLSSYPANIKVMDDFYRLGSIVSSPVVKNNVIYFGSADGYLYALNLNETGN